MARLSFRSCAMLLSGAVALATALAQSGEVRAQDANAPRRGGTLVFAITNGEPANYDCHGSTSNSVLHRVAPHYSMLVKIAQNDYPRIVGDAAESWTIGADALTYRFALHPNVRFHDGSILTSADVKATYERIVRPPPGVVSARQQLYQDIAAIDTPDERTVVFRLARPNAAMMSLLASPWNCLYSARQLAGARGFLRRTSWVRGRSASCATSPARSGSASGSTGISVRTGPISTASGRSPCRRSRASTP